MRRRHSPAGANPARKLSLQPVAVGADGGGNNIVRSTPMTKGRLGRLSDHTGHNASKRRTGASKRALRKPTRRRNGEGCQRSGSERREHRPVPPEYWRWHVWKRGLDATREALPVAWHAPTDSPRGSGRADRVAERSAVPRKPGNAGGGKGPQVEAMAKGSRLAGVADGLVPRR